MATLDAAACANLGDEALRDVEAAAGRLQELIAGDAGLLDA